MRRKIVFLLCIFSLIIMKQIKQSGHITAKVFSRIIRQILHEGKTGVHCHSPGTPETGYDERELRPEH